MNFVKMHGLGNDFIVIDEREEAFEGDRSKFAEEYCNRNFGIGADGVLWIQDSEKADVKVVMRNSDGSSMEMCGNGIRCIARFLIDAGHDGVVKAETDAGIIEIEQVGDLYRVNMGMADELGAGVVKGYDVVNISMGNPHAVIFEDVVDWKEAGKEIEHDSAYPDRTNVEFVTVKGKDRIKVNVWERGAGATLACGTGACAALVAASSAGKTDRIAYVELAGGVLEVEWKINGQVMMTGPAEEVFKGVIP